MGRTYSVAHLLDRDSRVAILTTFIPFSNFRRVGRPVHPLLDLGSLPFLSIGGCWSKSHSLRCCDLEFSGWTGAICIHAKTANVARAYCGCDHVYNSRRLGFSV